MQVVDMDPHAASQAGQYNDVSQVDKFELPKEEYEKRSGNTVSKCSSFLIYGCHFFFFMWLTHRLRYFFR
jgi:hypothetical protein